MDVENEEKTARGKILTQLKTSTLSFWYSKVVCMTHNWMRTLFEMEQLLSNKAQISMHDTQLDENLDLERQ